METPTRPIVIATPKAPVKETMLPFADRPNSKARRRLVFDCDDCDDGCNAAGWTRPPLPMGLTPITEINGY